MNRKVDDIKVISANNGDRGYPNDANKVIHIDSERKSDN